MTEYMNVMIVDDEPLVRESLTQRMPWEKHGFRLVGASRDGDEAIRLMEEERAEIVLLDITMPGMNGMDAAEIIKRRWPGTGILFLTAHDEFDYVKQALLLGADDFLLKAAVTPEEIVEKCLRAAEKVRLARLRERVRADEARMLAEHDWASRREALLRLIESPGGPDSNDCRFLFGPESGSSASCAIIWIGWDVYASVRDGTYTPQSLKKLQLQFLELPANEADPEASLELFPFEGNKAVVILAAKRSVSAVRLAERIVPNWLKGMERLGRVRCFARIQTGAFEPDKVKRLLKEGTECLSGYFYDPAEKARTDEAAAFSRLPMIQWLDLVSRAKKTFYGCGIAYLEEAYAEVRLLIEQRVTPKTLIRIAEAVVSEESDKEIASLREAVGWIETVHDYNGWWRELLHASQRYDPLGQKVTRKEIQEACKTIADRYREDIQLAVLAERAGLSVNYMGMLFRQETGQTFSEYLMRVRLNRAKELLERSSLLVYEIAGEVGMTDYRYFCKAFKKMFGTTPTQHKAAESVSKRYD